MNELKLSSAEAAAFLEALGENPGMAFWKRDGGESALQATRFVFEGATTLPYGCPALPPHATFGGDLFATDSRFAEFDGVVHGDAMFSGNANLKSLGPNVRVDGPLFLGGTGVTVFDHEVGGNLWSSECMERIGPNARIGGSLHAAKSSLRSFDGHVAGDAHLGDAKQFRRIGANARFGRDLDISGTPLSEMLSVLKAKFGHRDPTPIFDAISVPHDTAIVYCESGRFLWNSLKRDVPAWVENASLTAASITGPFVIYGRVSKTGGFNLQGALLHSGINLLSSSHEERELAGAGIGAYIEAAKHLPQPDKRPPLPAPENIASPEQHLPDPLLL